MIFPLIQLAVVTTFPLVNPINSGSHGPWKKIRGRGKSWKSA